MVRAAGFAALALLAATPACSQQAAPVLTWGSDPAPDIEALPRVAGASAPTEAINAFFDGLDAYAVSERAGCLADGPVQSEWGRNVSAPMIGPRFFSVIVTVGYYCGGAHPSWRRTHYTFDLRSGEQIDWTAMLPAPMHAPLDGPEYSFPAQLRSPGLKAWYAERAIAGFNADELTPQDMSVCTEVLSAPAEISEPLEAWLDARTPGLAFEVTGLAHAAMACTTTVVMPLDEARARGVAPELIAAIEAAHAAGGWQDPRPETPR